MKKKPVKIKPQKKKRYPTSKPVKPHKYSKPKVPVPMFLKFINDEISVIEILQSFAGAQDKKTATAATKAINNPPDLEGFRSEMKEAVTDIIREGPGQEFIAFVDHYMKDSLEEDLQTDKRERGVNVSRWARVKDEAEPWVQGFICYNLTLYIKAFGLQELKKCKVCSRFFNHKGKYAVYCSDECKAEGKGKKI